MAVVFVTGAFGFIGSHLSRVLAQSGHIVGGIGHENKAHFYKGVGGALTCFDGEVSATNLSMLKDQIGSPNFVYHFAGGSSVAASLENPRSDFERTVRSTEVLLDWMHREAPTARLVAASSAAVYGAGHTGPIEEDAPKRPYSPYGHHKLQMENMLRAYASSFGFASVIVRLFSVYGEGLRKQLLWDLCSRLARGERRIELQGTGDELRDWTDVRDTIRAIVEISALAAQDVPVVNVGSGIATSVRLVAETTLAAWGADPRAEVMFSGRARAGDPLSLQADSTKLESLGFHWRVPVSVGIADYVSWFRSQSDTAS